jgi:aminopeptidase N
MFSFFMTKYKVIRSGLLFCLLTNFSFAQTFTRADSLRGEITPLRACFDVLKYEIDVKFATLAGSNEVTNYPIAGAVNILALGVQDFEWLQVDLFAHLQIDSVVSNGQLLTHKRDLNAVYIKFPLVKKAGEQFSFKVYYHGDVIIAKRAPWDGGFVFTTDSLKNPWIGVACEGFGASSWWPCKDHLSDEPDSGVVLNIQIPKNSGLMAVGNGKLTNRSTNERWEKFTWEVKNPINTYNVSVNIGDYRQFSHSYISSDGEVQKLDYYVLAYRLEQAKAHFEQVAPMLGCFERLFGPYAFWEDGYKLVETPYWGMEHQSAVAYGNNYRNNKWGFDFIIIHESAHEWWGNSVSVADHADMWIHEGFTTYAETIYLECVSDRETAYRYLLEQRKRIALRQPMVGPYDVNFTDADTDVYFKGAWMLHTMRNSLFDDSLFFRHLKACYQHFYKQVTNTQEILAFWLLQMGEAYRPAWEHYLHKPQLPVLAWQKQGKGKAAKWYYRYEEVAENFQLPLTLSGKRIQPNARWQLFEDDFDATVQADLNQNYLLEIKVYGLLK